MLPLAAAADVVVQVAADSGRPRHDAGEEAAQRERVRQLRQRLPRGLQRCQVGRLQAPQQARLLLLRTATCLQMTASITAAAAPVAALQTGLPAAPPPWLLLASTASSSPSPAAT